MGNSAEVKMFLSEEGEWHSWDENSIQIMSCNIFTGEVFHNRNGIRKLCLVSGPDLGIKGIRIQTICVCVCPLLNLRGAQITERREARCGPGPGDLLWLSSPNCDEG